MNCDICSSSVGSYAKLRFTSEYKLQIRLEMPLSFLEEAKTNGDHKIIVACVTLLLTKLVSII